MENEFKLRPRGRGARLRPRRGLAAGILAGGLAALASSCGEGETAEVQLEERIQKIVGGSEATPGRWPSVAAILFDGSLRNPWWCGGTLIGRRWVVTAAHCATSPDASRYRVGLGCHDITECMTAHAVPVRNVIVHPEYRGWNNDIALLELAVDPGYPFTRMADAFDMAEIPIGYPAVALGWGRTEDSGPLSEKLREVQLDVLGVGDVCEENSSNTSVWPNEICIGRLDGSADTCQFDSGGPAFVRRGQEWALLGIISGGQACASAGYPGTYTYVPDQLEWVLSHTGQSRSALLTPAQILALN